jgi:hypothetical protein
MRIVFASCATSRMNSLSAHELLAQVEQQEPSLAEAGAIQVARHLFQRLGLGLRVAAATAPRCPRGWRVTRPMASSRSWRTNKTNERLGVHIVGVEASDLISEVRARSPCTLLEDIGLTIQPHPTLGERRDRAHADLRVLIATDRGGLPLTNLLFLRRSSPLFHRTWGETTQCGQRGEATSTQADARSSRARPRRRRGEPDVQSPPEAPRRAVDSPRCAKLDRYGRSTTGSP